MVITSAPAKIILLGEHAAVYGIPVLSASVDLRTYANVEIRKDKKFIINAEDIGIKNFEFDFSDLEKLKRNIKISLIVDAIEKTENYLSEKKGLTLDINSEIPVASGLGSSASLASALVLGISRELGHDLSLNEIANIAWNIEHIVHKKSSGVDPFTVTYGGVVRYKKGKIKKLKIKEYPVITLGNTKIAVNTGEVVKDVMSLKKRLPNIFSEWLKCVSLLIEEGQKCLEIGDLKRFGELMNINHGLLSAIGVSSSELDNLVWVARKKTSYAKLSGKGRGGIIIALGDAENEIKSSGGDVIKSKICDEGVSFFRC